MFNYLKKAKLIEILKYNKKLQKRLNLSNNNYKEYSQLYLSIEIELKLAYNKLNKFIYTPDEEKEIKWNYLDKNEKVNKIKIIIDYQGKSFKKLFYE